MKTERQLINKIKENEKIIKEETRYQDIRINALQNIRQIEHQLKGRKEERERILKIIDEHKKLLQKEFQEEFDLLKIKIRLKEQKKNGS